MYFLLTSFFACWGPPLGRAMACRVLFAGEHTHNKFPQSVPGAYLSGEWRGRACLLREVAAMAVTSCVLYTCRMCDGLNGAGQRCKRCMPCSALKGHSYRTRTALVRGHVSGIRLHSVPALARSADEAQHMSPLVYVASRLQACGRQIASSRPSTRAPHNYYWRIFDASLMSAWLPAGYRHCDNGPSYVRAM